MTQTQSATSMDREIAELNNRISEMRTAVNKFRKGFADALAALASNAFLGASTIEGVGIDVGARDGDNVVIWVECRGNGDIVAFRRYGLDPHEHFATVDPTTLSAAGSVHTLVAQWIRDSLSSVKMPIKDS